MARVEMMQQHGVQPVMVFDGGRLPMKAGEEDARQRWVLPLFHEHLDSKLGCKLLKAWLLPSAVHRQLLHLQSLRDTALQVAAVHLQATAGVPLKSSGAPAGWQHAGCL